MNTQEVQLTELEREVLHAVIGSDYQEDRDNPVDYPVWYLDEDDVDMKPGQLAGAISSCVKKGFVGIHKEGRESTIWITQLGFDVLSN